MVGVWIAAEDWIAAVGVLVLCAGWLLLRAVEGPPVLAMAFTFQWVQVTLGIYYHAATRRSLDTIELSDYRPMVLIGLGCLVALLFGLVLGMKVVRGPTLWGEASLVAARHLPALIVSYATMTVLSGAIQEFAWQVPSFTQALLALSYLRLGLLLMVFQRLSSPRVRWGWIGAVLLCEIPLGFLGYFAGFREPLIMAAIALLAAFDRRRLQHWVILGVLASAILSFGVLWMAIRGDYRHDLENRPFNESPEVRLMRIGELTSAWFKSNQAELFEDVDNFVDRLWVVYYPALAVSRVPSVVPHADGAILGRALLNLLAPRFLVPDKEALQSDSEMVIEYSGVQVSGAEEATNIAFGYAAESYVDFGVPLMFLPVFGYGFLMGMAYHLWLRIVHHRDLAVGLVTVMFWMCLYAFERSWIKTLGLTLTMMVYLGGATILLDRFLLWRRRTRGATRPAPVSRRVVG
jgi:hypothetical protein